MPSPAPEPLAPRPLSFWLVDACEDIPGEGRPPGRCWTLARILGSRGHDVIWWSSTWSHRRQATRVALAGLREDEAFAVRLVAARPFTQPASLARLRSDRDFARTFERLASEMVAAGHLERPDVIIASLPPLESTEAAARLAHRVGATLVIDVREPWPEFEQRQIPGPAFLRPLLMPLLVGNLADRQARLLAASDGVAATAATILARFVAARPELPQHVCYGGTYVQEFGTPRRHLDPVPVTGAASEAAPARPTTCIWTVEHENDMRLVGAVARGLAASGVPITLHAVPVGSAELPGRGSAAGGDGSLVVHERLSRTEYVRLLAEADIGVLPQGQTSSAALPDAVSDFAAAGLAMVHDLAGELADLLEVHEAGVRCATADAGTLVCGIAGLASDRRRLAAMQDAARRLATAAFDRERFYPRFADWLETLPG